MSHVTFDTQWRSAMRDLLVLVENELPVVDKGGEFDAQLAQGLPNEKGEKGKDDGQVELPVDTRSFKEFATAHLEYVSIFRQLEQVYDQMCHPQKRQSVKKAMEVTLGRVLETRHWMKHLNDGVEYFSLDDLAKDLGKDLDADFELPIPRSFVGDRSGEIKQRETFIATTLRNKTTRDLAGKNTKEESKTQDEQAPVALTPEEKEVAEKAAVKKAEVEFAQKLRTVKPPPMNEDIALRMIQVNERGRQGRNRALAITRVKKEQDLEDAALLHKRTERYVFPFPNQEPPCFTSNAGDCCPYIATYKALTLFLQNVKSDVVVICQALIRGFLVRRRRKRETDLELEFLGMKMPADRSGGGACLMDHNNAERRRALRDERVAQMESATIDLRQQMYQSEGNQMRDSIQNTINDWFVENRNPLTGEYPEFPGDDKGGSVDILDKPPPKPPPKPEEDPKAKAAREKKEADDKKKREAEKVAKKKAEEEAKKKGISVKKTEAAPEVAPVEFVGAIQDVLEEYHLGWGRKESDLHANFEQSHDVLLVADSIRPAVFEQIRKEVDLEMRTVLSHLREMIDAEKGGSGGGGSGKEAGKAGKGKKGGGKGGQKKGGGKKAPSGDGKKKAASGGKKAGGGKKKGAGKKDLTQDRTVESLFAELVECGVARLVDPRAYAVYAEQDEAATVSALETPTDGAGSESAAGAASADAAGTVPVAGDASAYETLKSDPKETPKATNPTKVPSPNPKAPHQPNRSAFPLAETFVGLADRAASTTERRFETVSSSADTTTGATEEQTQTPDLSVVFPTPTNHHARQIITTHVVLPLGASSETKARLPKHAKSVLLYGVRGAGKSFLTASAAKCAGCAFFDVSPRVIDGQYGGTKATAMLLHMTFKVAKLMAPSIIYCDDSEVVFLSDKKVLKSLMEKQFRDKPLCVDSASRVKKPLLAEIKALKKTDRVVFVGNARCPHALVKKDRKALLAFFDVKCELPVPEYATRRELWGHFLTLRFSQSDAFGDSESFGDSSGDKDKPDNKRPLLLLPKSFVTHELVVLTERYAGGAIWEIVVTTLSQRVMSKLAADLNNDGSVKLTVDAFLVGASRVQKTPSEELAGVREWTRSLAEFGRLKKSRDPPREETAVVDPKKKK